MKSGRGQVYFVAALVATAGVGLFAYKTLRLGYPLTPASTASVWDLELALQFSADGGPTKVRMSIPQSEGEFVVVGENFVSGEYGLTTETDAWGRRAVWSVREATGDQVIYYRAAVQRLGSAPPASRIVPPATDVSGLDEAQFAAAANLLDDSFSRSADLETLLPQLLGNLSDAENTDAAILVGANPTLVDRLSAAVTVLALAEIPARVVRGVRLERRLRNARLRSWLEVWSGSDWKAFEGEGGSAGPGEDMLVLKRGGGSLVSVRGGRDVSLAVAVRASEQSAVEAASRGSRFLSPGLLSFSLFSLPIRIQEVYRILLLVPVGAFLLVLLRTLVGVKTFGTFMPVLIALAFRETRLWAGIALFLIVVTLGLFVRFYLERLRLLLVPRLAAVLIVVVLVMLLLSVVSAQLGFHGALSVALFPMVILAITIERMSVVWEEKGAEEALQQGIGSLLVSILAYLVMTSRIVGHWIFVFPELLLVLLAACLLLGRYSGYRLLELWRFRAFATDDP